MGGRDPKTVVATLRTMHPILIELASNDEIHDLRRITYAALAGVIDDAANTIDALLAPTQPGGAA